MLEVSLAPGLLISMPQLNDPHFGRSVVLMVEHDDNGSFGLILNQASELPVTRLFGALDIEWDGDDEAVVYSGGPVLPESGWVLHTPVDGLKTTGDGLEIALGRGDTVAIETADTDSEICLSSSMTSLKSIAAARPAKTKFILGYAGWAGGQLAQEMARGSWLHAHVSSEIVFDIDAADMWKAALASLGIDPETIVQTRGVH